MAAADPRARLKTATAHYRAALKRVEAARLAQRQAIAAAVVAKVRQVEIVKITGYTREHIRRIAADTDPGD